MYIKIIDTKQTKIYISYKNKKLQLLKQTPPYGSTKCAEPNI